MRKRVAALVVVLTGIAALVVVAIRDSSSDGPDPDGRRGAGESLSTRSFDGLLAGGRVTATLRAPARANRVSASLAAQPGGLGARLTRVVRFDARSAGDRTFRLPIDQRLGRTVPACDGRFLVLTFEGPSRSASRRTVSRLRPSRTCSRLAGRGPWRATTRPPIDPRQKAIPFGKRSDWLQPWRGYLDTFPATRLRDGIGINFNVGTPEPWAADVFGLLARSGVQRVRIEVGWNQLDYTNPGKLTPQAKEIVGRELRAIRRVGIRPLIVLNSSAGGPTPSKALPLRLTQPARRGARLVRVDAASAKAIVPGRSGINAPRLLAGTLFTSVTRDGAARLSKPLDRDLPAGPVPASTLRFAPFGAATVDENPNREYEHSLNGWLSYTDAVTRFVKSVMGGPKFDVEVWNELGLNSAFLSQKAYYDPVPPDQPNMPDVLLRRTVNRLRSPARGLGGIDITSGFASQSPVPSAEQAPRGLDALSKHPYNPRQEFPAARKPGPILPLDARARRAKVSGPPGQVRETFVPRYTSLFPEYFLTAIQTETMIRDLAPGTTLLHGVPHGRAAAPASGDPLGVWITEMNTDLSGGDPGRPAANGARQPFPDQDREHILAKTTLRTLSAYVGKGARAVYMYAAINPPLGLVSPGFVKSAMAGTPPRSGGPIMDAVARFAGTLASAEKITRTRRLHLTRVADQGGRVQFRGDGTTAHPPLYDRDVLAMFPFQMDAHRWIAPTYVMTRDVAHPYRGGDDPRRFDLPDEPYRITLKGLDASAATAALYDPVTDRRSPARITARRGDSITVELLATDSPRMLSITDG